MATFDLDRAMRIYLGGDPGAGAIQIGMRVERLAAAFGPEGAVIDLILDAAMHSPEGHAIGFWLATELPSFSEICRQEIEAHVLYHRQR